MGIDYFSRDALAAEIRGMMWGKGEFRIVPYGYIWMVGGYNSSRLSNASYGIFVISDALQGEDEAIYDARNTRLGLDVAGPRLACMHCAKSGGKIEIDFQNVSSTANRGAILLRHAYVEVKDDDFRLLAGQTWDIISPLNPPVLMYSVGWGIGNIGYRRAQFRAERYLHVGNSSKLTLQSSINCGAVSDFATDATASGFPPGWPSFQGRLAWTQGECHPWTLGVSGHIGEQEFDFDDNDDGIIDRDDVSANTWSFNVDLNVPVTDRLTFSGEYFVGSNLGTFLGGIVQGVDRATGDSIRSHGGWFGLHYRWNDGWHSGFGFGMDDPNDNDLTTGGSQRRYNHWYWGNLVYNVTDQFRIGVEVSQWRTLYTGLAPGDATRVELMVKYGF